MTPSRRETVNPVRAASSAGARVIAAQQARQVVECPMLGRRDRVGRGEPLCGLHGPDALISSTEGHERGSARDERVGDDLDEVVALRQWQDPVGDDDSLGGIVIQIPGPSQLAVQSGQGRGRRQDPQIARTPRRAAPRAGVKWKKLSRARPNSAVVLASATRSPSPAWSATGLLEVAFPPGTHPLGDPRPRCRSVRGAPPDRPDPT